MRIIYHHRTQLDDSQGIHVRAMVRAFQELGHEVEVLSGNAEQAYNRRVNLVRRVYGDDREKVRLHLVSLFSIAGPEDPAVAAARRALASALF